MSKLNWHKRWAMKRSNVILNCVASAVVVVAGMGWAHADGGNAYAHLLLTPMCVLGFETTKPLVDECAAKVPSLESDLRGAFSEWRNRHQRILAKWERHCKEHVDQLYEEYLITAKERPLLMEGAKRFLIMFSMQGDQSEFTVSCPRFLANLREGKMDVDEKLTKEMERTFSEVLPNVLFMRAIDQNFRKDAPLGTNANYHRDRKWDFADIVSSTKSLKIAKQNASFGCRHLTAEKCISILGRQPDKRQTAASGEEHLIYLGQKLLYRGTPKDNRSIGPEWRILVAKDGKIVDEYEVVQVLERRGGEERNPHSCEAYGGPNVSVCSIVELIE